MSALNRVSGFNRLSFTTHLIAAMLACLVSMAGLTAVAAGPVFAQAATPSLAGAPPIEATPSASQDKVTPASANIGNTAPLNGPEKRVALVIGNSSYENVTVLPNPANDAKAIALFLNSAGFEVIAANDLNQDEIIQVLQDFSAKISERGPNTVAFVYYAGHGVQIAGDNYLIPVDAKINSEADLPNAAVRLVDVMATLQAVPSRMRIVILDACRNNPFSQLRDTGRGLAIVDAPNGSIVGYSTAPGTEALDGEGKNSPYTSAFLRLGREPNLPIEQFFKKVRVAVNDVTDGKQTPWESSSLTGDFYFFGDTVTAAAKAVAPSKPLVVASNVRTRTPREAYNYVVAEDSTEYYEEFVRVYPRDPFADRIRKLLAAKLLAAAWHGAVIANSPIAYKNFHSKYSDSPYANLALKLENQPKALPLYQPTKIMVPSQIAPQIKLTSFNGAAVPQGSNGPLGWSGQKNLLNQQGGGAPLSGVPGKGNPIANTAGGLNNGHIKTAPGIDLAKGGKRFDTRLDGNRVTTLPQVNQQHGKGISQVTKNDPKVLTNQNGGRVGSLSDGNRVTPRATQYPGRQTIQNQPATGQLTPNKRFQPKERMFNNNSNMSSGSSSTFRSSRTMSMNGGGGGGLGGGGTSFGRSFR